MPASWAGGGGAAATAAAAGDEDDEGPGCRESCSCGGGGAGGAAGCTEVEGPAASSVLCRFRGEDGGGGDVEDGPIPSCSQEEPESLPVLLLVLAAS